MQQNELLLQIEKNHPPIIIDVRSSFEYKSGHIQGAIHIPFWTVFFTDKLTNVDKTKTMVLYCEHGPRAGLAKLALSCLGFKNTHYLRGHMLAWKRSKLPIEKK